MPMFRVDLLYCASDGADTVSEIRGFVSATTAAAARGMARQRLEDERPPAPAGLDFAGWFICEAPGVTVPPRIAIRRYRPCRA